VCVFHNQQHELLHFKLMLVKNNTKVDIINDKKSRKK